MLSKEQLLDKIIEERKTGISYSELSKKYKLSKSTISVWCKDIDLSEEAKKVLKNNWLNKTKGARAKGVQANREVRSKSIKNEFLKAKELLGNVTTRDLFIMGIGLYWAEGSKKEDGGGFRFINSDPLMLKLMMVWLTERIKIEKDKICLNLAINSFHKDREGEILNFWSNLLDFPIRDFGRTTFIKTPYKRVYSDREAYFGMVRIRVKASSGLRRRVLGMIKIFTENMSV